MIVQSALICMALNIYHEARGEFVPGRYGVALVTMNRAQQDEEKVCEVVFKHKQFSWTSGVVKTASGWQLPERMRPRDKEAWRVANLIAKQTIEGRMPDFTQGADHYHAMRVKPVWRNSLVHLADIGNHRFYRSQ